MLDFKAKMHQIQFRLGELTAPPRHPSWIKGGLLLTEGKGEEWGNGRRGEVKGGRKREGIGPQVTVEPGPLRALLRYCCSHFAEAEFS